jgi:hypothetical protein
MRELNTQELTVVSGGLNLSGNRQSTNVQDRRNISNESRWGREGREDSPNDRAGSSANGSRVICTHFYKKGLIGRDVWRADLEYTFKNLSKTTIRGYHFWAIPYVRLMRESAVAERIMLPLAVWRADELAFQMGVKSTGSLKGKLVRLIGESVCFSIGLFVGDGDWESLWSQRDDAGGRLPQV